MSGRFLLASHRLSASLAGCVFLAWSAGTAVAQTVADPPQAPLAPNEPAVSPPAPDAPAPAPSEPAPPSQAPATTEPTPAPTELKPTPEPTPAAPADSPPPAAAPGSSAAFAPAPEATAKPATPPSTSQRSASAAPAAASASAASSSAQSSSKDDDDSGGGLLGPFRIGVLLGTGLPEVVSFGAQLKLTRFFGAGVNVGLIPTVKINYYGEAQQKFQEYDAYGHIYPFGGSFFLGAGVGYAQIDGILVSRFNLSALQQPGLSGNVDVTSNATVRTLVLTPQIGFLKIFDVGFAIGFDVGAQIPIAPSQVDFNTVAAGIPPQLEDEVRTRYINPNDEKVRHTLNTVGRTPLPTFNLKIGWFL